MTALYRSYEHILQYKCAECSVHTVSLLHIQVTKSTPFYNFVDGYRLTSLMGILFENKGTIYFSNIKLQFHNIQFCISSHETDINPPHAASSPSHNSPPLPDYPSALPPAFSPLLTAALFSSPFLPSFASP